MSTTSAADSSRLVKARSPSIGLKARLQKALESLPAEDHARVQSLRQRMNEAADAVFILGFIVYWFGAVMIPFACIIVLFFANLFPSRDAADAVLVLRFLALPGIIGFPIELFQPAKTLIAQALALGRLAKAYLEN